MTVAERALLRERLIAMRDEHRKAEDEDHYADTAETVSLWLGREHLLCADLLTDCLALVESSAP